MAAIRKVSPQKVRPQPVRVRAVVLRIVARVFAGPVLDEAAQLAFYTVLSLAPFLVVLTSLAAYLPSDDTVARLLRRAELFMPPDAFRLVAAVVDELVAGRSAALFTVGLVTSLWSASRAVDSLRLALNSAHGLSEGRSYVRRQAVAIALTLSGAALLLLSVVTSVVSTRAIQRLAGAFGAEIAAQASLWELVRWPLAVGSLTTLAALTYRVLPDTRPRAGALWWGALVATALFLAGSLLFSQFVVLFADFGPVYGSLSGGVALLLWSWLSGIAFIIGGEVTAAFPGTRPRRVDEPRQGLATSPPEMPRN